MQLDFDGSSLDFRIQCSDVSSILSFSFILFVEVRILYIISTVGGWANPLLSLLLSFRLIKRSNLILHKAQSKSHPTSLSDS